ncbi:MAG: hypothetical protein NVS1B10_02200 [Candidatus Saccharimonadales bacterium]
MGIEEAAHVEPVGDPLFAATYLLDGQEQKRLEMYVGTIDDSESIQKPDQDDTFFVARSIDDSGAHNVGVLKLMELNNRRHEGQLDIIDTGGLFDDMQLAGRAVRELLLDRRVREAKITSSNVNPKVLEKAGAVALWQHDNLVFRQAA